MATGFASIRFSGFFDRPAVVDAMDKKERLVLSGTGAYARGVMKKAMRRRNKISAPGTFPSSHQGDLKRLIFFAYDSVDRSVVVGPLLFKSALPGGKTVPQLINDGGNVRIKERRKTRIVTRNATYRPRPFVNLTLPFAAKQMEKLMAETPL